MTVKVYIETYGCAVNQADSEIMAGIIKKRGYELVNNPDDAYVIIINTCTVKTPTENNLFKRLKKLPKNKKIIITGCIPQTDPETLKEYSILGTSQIDKIIDVIDETLQDNQVTLIAKEKNPRLNLPRIRKNKHIEIIPICEGCLGDPCAYCKVKSARGELFSYDPNLIMKRVADASEEVKEIWLTAQDTGCYGKDINSSLPQLLKKIIKIPGNFKIRLGMLNPNHVYEYLNELIEVYKSNKIFKFLHIPVQSGNNQILKKMKRKYTVEQYEEIITKFRKQFPDITIATDIICGFPGETQEQFEDSIKLIEKTKPDVLNRSRFWPRPKTEAAEMPNQIHGKETKKRSTKLEKVFKELAKENNKKWLNWQGRIFIDEIGKNNTFVGRNYAYRPVIVFFDQNILGQEVDVKIMSVTDIDLRGIVK